MESFGEKNGEREEHTAGNCSESASLSEFGEERSSISSDVSSASDSGGQRKDGTGLQGRERRSRSASSLDGDEKKSHRKDDSPAKPKQVLSELEMMKERFAKLLLGEDMSGSGKGVCSAMAISNAITNLCATFFGQLWRLEPLSAEKKYLWQREMGWLLSVSDQIVEFKPSWQTFHDGSKLEVMSCRPRPDLYINLPALRKLDNMLIEVLDSFKDAEFWYTDADGSASFHAAAAVHHQEKWWLPSPRVPPRGLSEKTRAQLGHKRECANQILKAAMAINSNTLAEMEVPATYLDSLPKNGRTTLGDAIFRYIASESFFPEHLLNCLDLSSEHQALEVVNRVEAAAFVWRRRATVARTPAKAVRPNSRSSWGMVKEMMTTTMEYGDDKRELLAGRADILLLCLKQRFPGLTQTTLDMSKIQFNKDVGKSILEAYSRVLESLASNIIARVDDLFYVDDLVKKMDKVATVPAASMVSIPFPGTPNKAPNSMAIILPPLTSPVRGGGGRSPFSDKKSHARGSGVKKVLTDYLSVDSKNLKNLKKIG